MIRSMTAYGRSIRTSSMGTITCEIGSVNRKHLDIKCILPKEMAPFEHDIRQWLSAHISRGYVTLRVVFQPGEQATSSLRCNLPRAKGLLDLRNELSTAFALTDENRAALDWVLGQDGVIVNDDSFSNEEEIRRFLEEAILEALAPFMAMKEKEGGALYDDLISRLGGIAERVEKIDALADTLAPRMRERLLKLIEGLNIELESNEEVVLREVALLADRADIKEEITRFRSHISQLQGVLKKEDKCGKTAEFLIQEMFREINTVGSKASDLQITQDVIFVKSELERMREQIQNVE